MRSKNEFDDQLKSGVVKEGIVDRVRQYITRGTADKHTHIFLSSGFTR